MWVPPIGARVKLKTFDNYLTVYADHITHTTHAPVWAWLRVEGIVGTNALLQLLNGDKPVEGDQRLVPLEMIDPPLGWEAVYNVTVRKAEQRDQMLSWLTEGRGITVWQSEALESGGRQVFTPGDKNKPHWQFGMVETIHDAARFNIVVEQPPQAVKRTAGPTKTCSPSKSAMAVVTWLQSLTNVKDVKPVKVLLDNLAYEGAMYTDTNRDDDTRIILVGTQPEKMHKRSKFCFAWTDSPYEWYIGSYWSGTKNEHHPFGANFMLNPWKVPDGTRIDEYERKQYLRIPMTVETL